MEKRVSFVPMGYGLSLPVFVCVLKTLLDSFELLLLVRFVRHLKTCRVFVGVVVVMLVLFVFCA